MNSERLEQQHYRFVRRIAETAYSVVDEYNRVAPGNAAFPRVAVKRIPLTRDAATARREPVFDSPEQDQRVAELLLARGGDDNLDERRHPNVVHVLDVFVERDALFIVMECCSDGDLLQHMYTVPNGALDDATAVAFIHQILLGVQFLHAQCGIAHRDLCVENILLDNGVCRVADFGLSVPIGQLCSDFVGKLYYMAPEVAAREPYDPVKTDVWSLGVILFIMLTGSPLARQTEDGFRALMIGGVHSILVSWGLRDSIRTDVVVLLAGMLEIDPSKRLSMDAILASPVFHQT